MTNKEEISWHIVGVLRSAFQKFFFCKRKYGTLSKWNLNPLEMDGVDEEHENIVVFEDQQAIYGCFEDLEQELKRMGVPFNRHTDSYSYYSEEIVYFRPKGVSTEETNITLALHEGAPFVYTHDVRKLLKTGAADALKALLDNADPQDIVPLHFWDKYPYQHLLRENEIATEQNVDAGSENAYIAKCNQCSRFMRIDPVSSNIIPHQPPCRHKNYKIVAEIYAQKKEI